MTELNEVSVLTDAKANERHMAYAEMHGPFVPQTKKHVSTIKSIVWYLAKETDECNRSAILIEGLYKDGVLNGSPIWNDPALLFRAIAYTNELMEHVNDGEYLRACVTLYMESLIANDNEVDLETSFLFEPPKKPPKQTKEKANDEKLLKMFLEHWNELTLLTEYRFSGLARFYDLKKKTYRPHRWRADLLVLGTPVLIELHGATFVKGRHTTGQGFQTDRNKMNAATLLGFQVFELTRQMLVPEIIIPIGRHCRALFDPDRMAYQLDERERYKHPITAIRHTE